MCRICLHQSDSEIKKMNNFLCDYFNYEMFIQFNRLVITDRSARMKQEQLFIEQNNLVSFVGHGLIMNHFKPFTLPLRQIVLF